MAIQKTNHVVSNNVNSNAQGGTILSDTLSDAQAKHAEEQAVQELIRLIDEEQQVGDLIGIDFGTADILVHDALKQQVGGVPQGCFLLATRIQAQNPPQLYDQEASLILLRVIGRSTLPNDIEMKQARLEAGQRASDTSHNWDQRPHTDNYTLHQMRYAGIQCRILGTFRMSQDPSSREWRLDFGADIDNFYTGQGMKIYKPVREALERIANFTRISLDQEDKVDIGRLRYAAAIKNLQAPESVPIRLVTRDLVARRTALFGMTRTGKSNTTKTIAAALFRLRLANEGNNLQVGQLILDPNGEYANENPQDQGCLKNVRYLDRSVEQDVVTYGLVPHPYDTERKITKFDFFGDKVQGDDWTKRERLDKLLHTLYQGKEIIDDLLREESASYILKFVQTDIRSPSDVNNPDRATQYSSITRYKRAIFVYRSILAKAGFSHPTSQASIQGLFSKEFKEALRKDEDSKSWSLLLNEEAMTWEQAGDFCEQLSKFVRTGAFKDFDNQYAETKNDRRKWSDDRFLGLLTIFENTRGLRMMGNAREWHESGQNSDYVDDIVKDLREGRLVIIDQAIGDPNMNRVAAERIMWKIFNRQKQDFINPETDDVGELISPPPIVIYAEEAHTLLPKGSETDVQNIWARVAKEGAKFEIGLVYSTQEPSSIQSNILKNTENWFIAHLNNTDELREVKKYNDFDDFAESILRVNEPGFLRMRTLSSSYTLPVQVELFSTPTKGKANAIS